MMMMKFVTNFFVTSINVSGNKIKPQEQKQSTMMYGKNRYLWGQYDISNQTYISIIDMDIQASLQWKS